VTKRDPQPAEAEDPRLRHPLLLDEPPPVPAGPEDERDEEMPRVQMTRRNLYLGLAFVTAIVAFLYFVLPQIQGLGDTWNRIERGDPAWLALAVVFTTLSFGGYILMFHRVYVTEGCGRRVGLRESYEITMASLAATRLFAAGGAGGIALTAWALRQAGMRRRDVADRSVTFLALTYAFYMLALVVCGLGLTWGIFGGEAPWAVTTVPAIFAMVVLAFGLLSGLTPTDLERRLEGWARHGGRLARFWHRAAALPATMSAGIRLALGFVCRGDWALLGVAAYWGFNIAVLWASFRAFGQAPPWAVVLMGYFVGMFGNLLPLPGGVGGVDGGMIGAFIAFDVDQGLAVVAVLTYRAFAFWLPTVPGALAYFQLRRTVARWRAERRLGRAAVATATSA
jgi:uncharacterized membrane protein YbhN (UPF0104 family)